jgi:hypothetical protein
MGGKHHLLVARSGELSGSQDKRPGFERMMLDA